MTKEEQKAVEEFTEMNITKKGLYHYNDMQDAFLIGLFKGQKMSQPSLPSNLDEAAEEYAYTNWEDDDYHEGASEGLPFDAIGHTEKCFKAGAEWMAGQGVKATATVGYYNQSGLSILTEPSIKKLGFKEGDELEITIRKK